METSIRNPAMQRKVSEGEAVDLSGCRVNGNGDRIMRIFYEGMDYCILETGEWIWSIGKHEVSGQILASTSTKFYTHPDYKCIWLR